MAEHLLVKVSLLSGRCGPWRFKYASGRHVARDMQQQVCQRRACSTHAATSTPNSRRVASGCNIELHTSALDNAGGVPEVVELRRSTDETKAFYRWPPIFPLSVKNPILRTMGMSDIKLETEDGGGVEEGGGCEKEVARQGGRGGREE
jgi:hypothetical protein